MRDLDCAESYQGLQVELYLAEKVLQKVKENLSVSTLVLAVDNKGFLDLHVDFSRHLWSQISRSIFVKPLFSQDVENVGIVLIL